MKIFFKHIFIFSIAFAAVYIIDYIGVSCPFRYIFKIPCPTCGMTRSLFAFLKGDFLASLKYNLLTFPFIFVFLFGIHYKKLGVKKKTADVVLTSFSLVLFGLYLFKLFY